MFEKLNWLAAVFALLLFAHAQFQGWNLFEEHANPRGSSGAGGSGRIYHK